MLGTLPEVVIEGTTTKRGNYNVSYPQYYSFIQSYHSGESTEDSIEQRWGPKKNKDNDGPSVISIVGATLVGLGQPIISKKSIIVKFVFKKAFEKGAHKNTSIASIALRKIGPWRSPVKLLGSKTAGGILGRFVPYVGWGLLAYDIWDNREDIAESAATTRTTLESANDLYGPAVFCFAKGTLVKTKEGYSPIDKINKEDFIYSFNFETNSLELSKVTNTFHKRVEKYYTIETEKEKIVVTSEHPFYVVDKGWVKVKDLKPADLLKSSGSDLVTKIVAIELFTNNIDVYNIEVEGNHNYFVTRSQLLVHNKNITNYHENIYNMENFDKLKKFVAGETTVHNIEITRDTRIEDDLGIYGDDADDFIIKFGETFNVEVDQFHIGEYFSDEGDFILPALIRFFTNTKKRERKVLTIGDLEKAIAAGKLDEEIINLENSFKRS